MKISAHDPAIERAADALRLYEMRGRITLPWDKISGSQKRRWCEKAEVVLKAAAPAQS